MVHLNIHHIMYDFDMEVLSFIPPPPRAVNIEDIAYDLLVDNNSQVFAAIRQHRQQYRLLITYACGEPIVKCLSQSAWNRMSHHCELYCDQVWNGD